MFSSIVATFTFNLEVMGILHFHQKHKRVPFSLHPHQYQLSYFLITSILVGGIGISLWF